jgi:hypothetical protein
LRFLQIVQADEHDAMWAAEQCLRSAACAVVLCWPRQADTATLRRLQLAAETGQTTGFLLRPAQVAPQASMAAVRVGIETGPARLRVLKCRGGNPPLQPIVLSRAAPAFPPPSAGRGSTGLLAADPSGGCQPSQKPSPSVALRARSPCSALRAEGGGRAAW